MCRRRRLDPIPSSMSSLEQVFTTPNEVYLLGHRALLLRLRGAIRRKRMFILDFFRAMDSDRDGMLSPQELYGGITWLGIDIDAQRLMALHTRVDLDRDGKLSFDEFKGALLSGTDDDEIFDAAELDRMLASAGSAGDASHTGIGSVLSMTTAITPREVLVAGQTDSHQRKVLQAHVVARVSKKVNIALKKVRRVFVCPAFSLRACDRLCMYAVQSTRCIALIPPSPSPSPLPPPSRSTHNSRKCGRRAVARTAPRPLSGPPSLPNRCLQRRSRSSSASDTTPLPGGAIRPSAPRRRRAGRNRPSLLIYTSSKSPTPPPVSSPQGLSTSAQSSTNSSRTLFGALISFSLSLSLSRGLTTLSHPLVSSVHAGELPPLLPQPPPISPHRYHLVWAQERAEVPLYVWEPVSPSDDFVAIGMICSNSVDPPPLTEVRCVSARFLAASSMRAKKIWADSASSGGKAGSLWRVSGIGSLGASDTHLAPPGPWCELRASKAFPADQYPAISPAVKRLLQQRIDELEDVGAADAAIAERAEERRVAAGLTGTGEEKSRWLTTSSAWLDNSELHTDSMVASVGSEGPATNVLVDDEETCWQPVSAAEPHWLAFDLQREYNISKFIVRPRCPLAVYPLSLC